MYTCLLMASSVTRLFIPTPTRKLISLLECCHLCCAGLYMLCPFFNLRPHLSANTCCLICKNIICQGPHLSENTQPGNSDCHGKQDMTHSLEGHYVLWIRVFMRYWQSAADVRNVWSYTATPLYAVIVLCLIKHNVNFIFVGGAHILFVCCLSKRREILTFRFEIK